MRHIIFALLAACLIAGCGGNNTFSPTTNGIGQAGSFTIAGTPGQNSVTLGNSANYTITATSTGSFNSPVTITASGAPAGATVTIAPQPITPTPGGTDTTLTINTGGNLDGTIRSAKTRDITTGTYTITIKGVGGGQTQQTTVTLDVLPAGGGG